MARTLIARESETAALDRALDEAGAGDGAVVVIEGPAGIGKTVLLDHVREAAQERGATVLGARASELDRGFGFGVVHQLFEPLLVNADQERRARLLAGAAARAELVLAPGGAPADEAGYAVLHGLYWLVANLAEEGPLVLAVDDVQWADPPSMRFLEYLGRRLDGLTVAIAATVRSGDPGARSDVLAELSAGPVARVLHPRPLAAPDVADVLAGTLESAPDPAFSDAALEATGGNPLLLTMLAREARALGLDGTADEGARLAELGARGVAPAVQRRLRPLGPDAAAVARAAAIAGERALADDVAALADLDLETTRALLDRLATAGILARDGRAFVHPLVKAAVLETGPAADRMRLHRLAATRLRERGARPAETALHWLAAEPSGDERAVQDLRAAADAAVAEGASDVAADLLERALAEPPPAQQRPELLLELGELEVRAQRPAGHEHLQAALAAGLAGDAAARARAALGTHLVHTDPASALAEVERGLAEASDPGLRLRLEAFAMEALIFVDAFGPAREARFAAGREDPDPSPVMLAHLAVDGACAGLPREQVRALAERALAGGALMEHVGPASSTWNLTTHALRFAEAPDRCADALKDGERVVRERGLTVAQLFIEQSWGYWHRDFGSVAAGASRSRLGLEATRELGMGVTIPALAAIAAENLAALDRLDEAAAEIDVPVGDAADTYVEPFALAARGLVRHLQRRRDEAETDLRRVVALGDARGWRMPTATRGRLRLAAVLAAKGEREEALALADHDVAAARAAQLPGALGAALRVRALALDGGEAIEQLQEAVETLAPTPFRLEHGWALHDLGARLRAAGQRRDAREPLRVALDIAARTEAARLGRHVRAELEASGAQPRRERLSGVESLTPAERRVADMAAEGMSNRQIAEALWVTLKTVEVHLGRCYAKLDIRSRRQLADVLGTPEAAAA